MFEIDTSVTWFYLINSEYTNPTMTTILGTLWHSTYSAVIAPKLRRH